MSMTESEATREMTFDEEYEILQAEKNELFSKENDNEEPPFANCVVRRALRCIRKLKEEREQYRAIGTVSEFRELKGKKYDCDIKHLFGECSYAETGCSDCIGKLKIKDALEKATAKKPSPYVPDCASINFIKFVCPNCKKDVPLLLTPRYCNCGQHLDWSEGKE